MSVFTRGTNSFVVARVPLVFGDMVGRLVSAEQPAAPHVRIAGAHFAATETPCPFCGDLLRRLLAPAVRGRVVKLYEDTVVDAPGGRCCQALIDPPPPGTVVLSCGTCSLHLSTREDAA